MSHWPDLPTPKVIVGLQQLMLGVPAASASIMFYRLAILALPAPPMAHKEDGHETLALALNS